MERAIELTNRDNIDSPSGGPGQQRPRLVLRSIAELEEPLVQSETCFTLANARVVWANYDLIQRDFADIDFASAIDSSKRPPSNSDALFSDRPDIDAWLLNYAAIMSEGQLRFTDTNEPIPVFGPARVAYRPPRYGRAMVVQLQDTWPDAGSDTDHRASGLLDVKGCGAAGDPTSSARLYQSGLFELPFAFCEAVSQLILERIFERLQVDIRGVGVYAILDLGFRTKIEGCWMPAGAIVRRAHQRPPGNIDWPHYGTEEHRLKVAVEFMLRPFGVTSCARDARFRIWRDGDQLHSSYLGRSDRIPANMLERFLKRMSVRVPVDFDMINVQLVRGATLEPLSADLVDFGQFDFANQDFVNPMACFVEDRPLHWGGFIDRNSRYWVQPNPEISVNDILAGWVPTPAWIHEWAGSAFPATIGHLLLFTAELVRDITMGNLTRHDVDRRIGEFVETATSKLDNVKNKMPEQSGQGTPSTNSESVPDAPQAQGFDALDRMEGFLAQNALRWRCNAG